MDKLLSTNPGATRFSSPEIFFKLKGFFSKVFQFGNIAKSSPAISEKAEDASNEIGDSFPKSPDSENSEQESTDIDNEIKARFHNNRHPSKK